MLLYCEVREREGEVGREKEGGRGGGEERGVRLITSHVVRL